ncbi:MAG: 1-deoxy-D-xylulose-5-phosphate reductoisomerase [Pseudomonadota bacterium]
MKHLAILGSTGSIGTNALEIVRRFPERFRVRALSANTSTAALAAQIVEFAPEVAVMGDADHTAALRKQLPAGVRTELLIGIDGCCQAAAADGVDTVVTAVVGAAGLMPTIAAIEAGKTVALANKETLVMAGELVIPLALKHGAAIVPVDSEHSAIFQCLAGNRRQDVARLLLTGSGGPFRTWPLSDFPRITLADALRHPNWAMGRKITIDSATMMNKGLEVIEAKHLFGVSLDQISVLVHPQSIVHSMVVYRDGSVLAQMGAPDMKGAIAYALSHPERLPIGVPAPDFIDLAQLQFEAPDFGKFPCLAMAFEAINAGGTWPAVLNAANEVAVEAFLGARIEFVDIPRVIRQTLDQFPAAGPVTLEAVVAADAWARQAAAGWISSLGI